jgi:hypothetical protein
VFPEVVPTTLYVDAASNTPHATTALQTATPYPPQQQ